MRKTIYLFRHGTTDWNAQKRFQGRTAHVPLNELGIEQANKIADVLGNKGVRLIYSSPLLRAMQTADIVARRLLAAVIPVTDLQERSFGRLEGLSSEEIERIHPDAAVLLRQTKNTEFVTSSGDADYEVERLADVQTRIHDAIKGAAMAGKDECLAISTHAAVAYNFLCRINEEESAFAHMGNGDVLIFDYSVKDGAFSLKGRAE